MSFFGNIFKPVTNITGGLFKMLGLKPEVPDVKSLPAPPSADEAAAEAERARLARKRKYGRQDTILTSPLGDTGQATTSQKTLLGN